MRVMIMAISTRDRLDFYCPPSFLRLSLVWCVLCLCVFEVAILNGRPVQTECEGRTHRHRMRMQKGRRREWPVV